MKKMILMDVDGTLTDGKIYIGNQGEVMKAFNVKDGYGIAHLKVAEILPVIITGRKSDIVAQRAKELNITELYQGVEDKLKCLKKIAVKYEINIEEIAYIGDDLNDLLPMSLAGYIGCPADSCTEIKKIADYISKVKGGHGAVRDIIEHLLREAGCWDKAVEDVYGAGV